jgi:three-Cys-motif partner protein
MNIDVKQLSEPYIEWGGFWTKKKLDAFAKYVVSYLRIMKYQPQWETIYFDGFAGSGSRKQKKESSLYKQLKLTKEEKQAYKGAAERVLSLPDNLSFDYHYFIDLDQNSLDKLKERLSAFQHTKHNEFQFKPGDCNIWLHELSNALKAKRNKYAALILLDPFGMQINWESIASLKGTRSDIWILIPTGVVVNRLLDKEGKLKYTKKLQSFFGLKEEDIKEIFYSKRKEQTLFGEVTVIQKIKEPIEKIAEIYINQLKTIWSHVTEKPLELTNSKEVPIYHFVFASNNKYAVKIAKEIIEGM